MARKTRQRKKEKKFVQSGKAYIAATFNNTIITLTDDAGNVLLSSGAGTVGFKGSRADTIRVLAFQMNFSIRPIRLNRSGQMIVFVILYHPYIT